MIINGSALLQAAPIKNMIKTKKKFKGLSHGLGEAGYDIRIAQTIRFTPDMNQPGRIHHTVTFNKITSYHYGRFVLASAMEEFEMPTDLVAVVHDKSTWARQGLSVFNTVIEPGFIGGLTLELVYHGEKELLIPAGVGIAQVVFRKTEEHAQYKGKYQGQGTEPIPARKS